MLTGKQKRYLRAKAHHIDPIFQVGKGGINGNLIDQLNDALEKRELIKVSVLQNNMDEKEVLAEELARRVYGELVQVIGSTIILYKPSRNHKQLELPR
ncbi:ribosome assembly RNA-binding protein YhbY [Macrococcus equipercicus]|uniref:Ribosome assembly RNA-binding protein YhbY n=1 Tax=Macrococcus equipercicus TaxID=69967 RepID=A0A9Q9F0I6_9STAP|nr:ribosome assembly RNA-binding protein YhbY [Macrococcus equipercicus]KAA1040048.1 ribosome assembly RNA-binding protein YhbY [Macrococcus equipercicus]UTH13003.1 ribosome assembly RNA-binding protein YhbY [Macrococcus equipercicus]